jgi:hypothetical protein
MEITSAGVTNTTELFMEMRETTLVESYNSPIALSIVTCGRTGTKPGPPKLAWIRNPAVDCAINQFPVLVW